MSIQDDYMDVQTYLEAVEGGHILKAYGNIATWAFNMEEELDKTRKKLADYRTTMKTMMGITCPAEIRIAHKLLRQRADGSLGPLFINRSQIIPVGLWMHAEEHRTKGYAFRPGWHVLLKPEAPHLKKVPKREKRVWAKVAVVDYEVKIRPDSQGGKWLLAQKMIVLEVIG